MVKPTRPIRNRRRRNNALAQVSRVASGLPFQLKRLPSDPPPLPTQLTYDVTIRCTIRALFSTSDSTNVVLGSVPSVRNVINLQYTEAGFVATRAFFLTSQEIAYMACVQVFGISVAEPTNYNFAHTEYSIRKVTFYGASTGATSEVQLSADSIGAFPGCRFRDSAGSSRSARVGVSFPRMSYFVMPAANPKEGLVHGEVSLNTSVMSIMATAPKLANRSVDVGTLDIVVSLRRGYVNSATVGTSSPQKRVTTTFQGGAQ